MVFEATYLVAGLTPGHMSACADYPKVWPFPTKRLATSTTTSKKLCLIQMFVLGWRKGRWRYIAKGRKRSWQKLLMAPHCTRTFAVSVFHEKPRICSFTSAHRLQVARQAHVEATCRSRIPPQRCNASSRQRVLKSNFR